MKIGKTLSDDSLSLGSCGLQSGSVISLLLTEPTTIQVFLKNQDGRLNTYEIKPDETVTAFKQKVQAREGVQASQQRLLHESREMMDGGRLSDYNVKAHSTIVLMLHLRGG
uniref:ISG15 ubiquitin like modifier n=1 Tax=Takifugu rubripes TaxID=31033 RepID=A0A674MBK9_TAKRU